jgi:GNAT superfamily N-acetyltransferase
MQEVLIQRATADDVEAILPLLAVQLAEHGMGKDDSTLRGAIRGLIEWPERGAILIARRSAETVGIAVMPFTWTVEHGGKVAWLDELYVKPELREEGIGTKLLEAVLDLARSEGLFAIDLEVDEGHARVASLYTRFGFHSLPRKRFSLRF